MSAGDFILLCNSSDSSGVGTGATEQMTYDQVLASSITSGSITTPASNQIQFNETGIFLLMYSEKFETIDTTNNERFEINGSFRTSAAPTVELGGYGQGYIRKSSGHQQTTVTGVYMVEVTSAPLTLVLSMERTDNSATPASGPTRVPLRGYLQAIQLDTSDSFGLYQGSGSVPTSGVPDLTLSSTLRQDTGLSRSGNDVTITDAGRYLVTYSMDLSIAATGRTEVVGLVTLNDTEVVGSRDATYMRGSDGTQDGAVSWAGIVDVAASDVLTVKHSLTGGSSPTVGDAHLGIWRLPASADTVIVEATTGDWNTGAEFTWDTLPHIDTDSFTATAGTSEVTVDQQDILLAFATFSQFAPDSPQRASPEVAFNVNGTAQDQTKSSYYHRNSSNIGDAATNSAGILPSVQAGNTIGVDTLPTAAAGTLNNDAAQMSLLSLTSLYTYVFPPVITDAEDEQLTPGEPAFQLDGANFGSVQGTGEVYLASSADFGTATLVTQNITSWSDTQIILTDITQGALPDGTIFFFVEDDAGSVSAAYAVNIGLLGYNAIVENLLPDHKWRLNNDGYADTGVQASNPMTSQTSGSSPFVTTPICEDNTHSMQMQGISVFRECANSSFINSGTQTARSMGGWIRLGDIQQSLASLYEEGGGVNNLAFFTGYGNVLVAQLADTGDDNVQAFSDLRLDPDRDYHILFRFDYAESPAEFRLYLDGVEQSVTSGNPLTSTDLDSHTGDITWGNPGGSLEVGGTDVTFQGKTDILYAQWATWTRALDKVTEIPQLFKRGARPDVTISATTQAAQQLEVDALGSGQRANAAMALRIQPSSDGPNGGDVDLTFDGITFDPNTSIEIEWRGASTLTITLTNGAAVDSSKFEAPNGGTIVIVETVTVAATVNDVDTGLPVENARVYITADTGGPLADGTVIFNGLTDASGQISTSLQYSADQPITGRVRKGTTSPLYKTSPISGSILSSGFDTTVFLVSDE